MYYNDVTPGWRTYYFEDGSNYYFDDRYRGRDGECFDQSGDRTRCGSQFYYYDYTYDDYDDPSTYKYDIADWWIGGECFDYKINRYVPCFEDYRPPGYNREEDYWYYDYERSEGESNDYWDRRWQDYDDFLQNQYYWYYWND